MNQLVKKFNNFIKKTIFNVQNKTNDKLQIFKTKNKTNNKLLISKFNNFIKKTIFNVQNKTNDKLQIFKTKNKTNNKLLISKFNKYLITLISLLFFYLFYLSIPILYNKNWVQKNVENQLLKDFKIYFSLSSDISYRILPSPHYLVKDSKIIKEDDKTVSLAEIKTLKVFISQKNFFDKNRMELRRIEFNNANFTLLGNDLKTLKKSSNNKFSNKKIKIKKSKIIFKNNSDEIISVIKISEAVLFRNEDNLSNLFKLQGEVFNVPFNFDYNKDIDSLKTEEINIVAKKLKLDFFNTHSFNDNNSKGRNIISFLNSKINTNYKIEDDTVIFGSSDSRIENSNISYNAKMSMNPFNLDLNVSLDNHDLRKVFNKDFILNELIRTELLFNDNISVNTSINTSPNLRNKIFQNAKFNFNISDGKLNINKTRLINNKIGSLEFENSNLSYTKNLLFLNTDISVNIKNYNKLFSLLQTNKKFRKPITNILINLDYNFLSKEINFNSIKVDGKKINSELLRIIEGFNNNEINNWNKSKRLLNTFFENYEG